MAMHCGHLGPLTRIVRLHGRVGRAEEPEFAGTRIGFADMMFNVSPS
jgi:hypothetical protein